MVRMDVINNKVVGILPLIVNSTIDESCVTVMQVCKHMQYTGFKNVICIEPTL